MTDRADHDETLSIIAHELRNELNVLTTWAGLLLRADIGAERRRQAAAAIHRGTEIARRLCDDLGAVIADRELTFAPTRVDLCAIANAGVVAISADARRKGVRIIPRTSPIPVWVIGDRIHLAEVVSNLLTNAVAYSAPGDSVTVEVSEREGAARLVVADTGAGISTTLLPHVFDKFSREPGTQRAGRGLGLYVVRRLVERHQGSVRVESAGLGLGARFVVTLASASVDAA